jgi:hypothetical protein
MENTVHFTLQGKGGIGKSFITSLLCEYIQNSADRIEAFDTDQINTTLSQYDAFQAKPISIKDDDHLINPKKFDSLIVDMVNTQAPVIVDTGANSFTALVNYIISNQIFELLLENKKRIYIHTIIAGGDMRDDTANGFNALLDVISVPTVLWINEHFGSTKTDSGRPISESKLVQKHMDNLIGAVWLNKLHSQTFGEDVNKMAHHRLTTAQAIASPLFNIVEKQRIKIFARSVFDQLDKLDFSYE